MILQFIIVALLAAPLGILIYELIRRGILKKKADDIIRNAEIEGENIKKEKIKHGGKGRKRII